MSDPFKDTRDPLVRSMERREVEALRARVVELERERETFKTELDRRVAFEDAQCGDIVAQGPAYIWAISELTRRKAWSKSAVASIIAEQRIRAETAEQAQASEKAK